MKTYKIILPNGKTIKYNAEYFNKADKDPDFYFFISKNNVGVAPDGSAVFELDCQNTNSVNIREGYKEFIYYLFELRGRTLYEIDTIKKLCEQKCSIFEAGRLRGSLEILEDVIVYIDEIVKKYSKTHSSIYTY